MNGGYQASTTSFDDRFTFDLNREVATVDTTYPIDAGPLFDAGVSVRLWKGLGIGGAVSRFTADGVVQVEASLPHPLFFQRNREVSGESGGLTREETAHPHPGAVSIAAIRQAARSSSPAGRACWTSNSRLPPR